MSRSNRNTGAYRAYRGSGPVGTLPQSKPGKPDKRRRTKPLVQGKHTTPEYHESVLRGKSKIVALIRRAFVPQTRMSRIASAVRGALRGD